jgi:hypothetical protein
MMMMMMVVVMMMTATDMMERGGSARGAAGFGFDDTILFNRRLVEGLRGVFAFMVLWDHFHDPSQSTQVTLPTLALTLTTRDTDTSRRPPRAHSKPTRSSSSF